MKNTKQFTNMEWNLENSPIYSIFFSTPDVESVMVCFQVGKGRYPPVKVFGKRSQKLRWDPLMHVVKSSASLLILSPCITMQTVSFHKRVIMMAITGVFCCSDVDASIRGPAWTILRAYRHFGTNLANDSRVLVQTYHTSISSLERSLSGNILNVHPSTAVNAPILSLLYCVEI
jgi:hypothetical protein